MAVLEDPPTQDIIKRLKGKLDFYNVNGQWRVRRWPQMAPRTQTPAEILAQCHQSHANLVYGCTPAWVREEYSSLTSGMWWTRRDYFMKHYFGTIDPYDHAVYGHHPPQPSPCPGGNGHYWAMLGQWSQELGYFHLRHCFWFDQPLYYKIMCTRTPPPYFTWGAQVRGQYCELGRGGARAGIYVFPFPLGRHADGYYYCTQAQTPGNPQIGRWFGYIVGEHPHTHHPALSLTPWVTWTVTERFGWQPPTPVVGITMIEHYVTNRFPWPDPWYPEPRTPVSQLPPLDCMNTLLL